MDTSGFYKYDGMMIFGPNFVINANYELKRETKDTVNLPLDGWYWFDNEDDAYTFFNVPKPVTEE